MLQFCGIHRFILFGQIIFLPRFINAFPDGPLTTTIVDKNGVEMELKWLKTKQLLANENLPIWRAQPQTNLIQDKQVMKNLGNFETYHDLDKSSAVIYLEKTNSLYGIIGSKYFLAEFPVDKLHEKHTVGHTDYLLNLSEEIQTFLSNINYDKPSIFNLDPKNILLKKRPYVDNEAPTSSDDSNSLNGKRPRFNEKHDSSHTSETNLDKPSTSQIHLISESDKYTDENSGNKPLGPFYPEILLLVSHNLMKTTNPEFSIGDNLDGDVMYYLILMNAVSMLYAKLARNVEININIAGIIFEETAGAFPFSTSQYVNGQLICPNQQLVSDSISNYINDAKFVAGRKLFSEDSFDFFVFATEFNHVRNQHKEIPRGISTPFFDIYAQRVAAKLNSKSTFMQFETNFKVKKFLGSIIDNSGIFLTYVDIAREIGHLMNINDDDVKSYTIMEKNAFNLYVDFFRWSSKSIEGFKTYFSQNENRCFLLNKPRSLDAFDIPRMTLSVKDQCACYGFTPTSKSKDSLNFHHSYRSCRIRLPCPQYYLIPENGYKAWFNPHNVPYPVDGTQCGPNKVCWQKRCVHGIINI